MSRLWCLGVILLATPGIARAQRWTDATSSCIGTTAEWSNKVELADVDGDGLVDLLIANGGGYSTPGAAEPTRVWKNLGGWGAAGTHCQEISGEAVLGFVGSSRVVKAIDVDGDGDLDILTGGAYQTQLKLYLRGPSGWTDGSAQLPQQATSIGDLEAGDVDGDGDLDLLLSDWGAGNAQTNTGGRTRLYLNNGSGVFTDATATNMPDMLVRWSWDVELADVDGDWDLDALISCKSCTTSLLFRNDGGGRFTNDPDALPHFANNYDFEPMDIDGDGDLDLVTINDGAQVREHIFVNDGTGTFTDDSAARLTGTANPAGADDNVAVWLDVDNDGDSDLLIGELGPERLCLNDGHGVFTLSPNATPNDTDSTLGLAIGDLDGDGRLDLLQGQGESAFPDKVQLASAEVAVDTRAPAIKIEQALNRFNGVFHAQVHDFHSGFHPTDFQRVWIEHDGEHAQLLESAPPPDIDDDMHWIGGFLWASPDLPGLTHYKVCATDRQGNSGCSETFFVEQPLFPDDFPPIDDAGMHDPGKHVGSGCCDAGGSSTGSAVLVLLMVGCAGATNRRARRVRRARRLPLRMR